MPLARTGLLAALALMFARGADASAQTLRGSLASVMRQHDEAVRNDFTLLESASDVSRFVKMGVLVRVRPGTNYDLARVSHPYVRPVVLTFIERLAAQYKSNCGERLVVTSLTRPANEQPRNASVESVHPAGIAVDLRLSGRTTCRRWIEAKLLAMEKQGVIEATRERRPAHLHVAVFSDRYAEYLRKTGVPTEVTTLEKH